MSERKRQDPFAGLAREFPDRLRGDRWQPDVDVFETDKDVVVRAELAGVRSEQVHVSVNGPVLCISGERHPPGGDEVQRLHQMEIALGRFERRIELSIPFESERVTAHLADGFLTVTLPKRIPVRSRVEILEEGA